MRTIGTVRLNGECIRCTRWSLGHVGSAELELPLPCDVTALAAYEAACTLARDVWYPGVTLGRPRLERGDRGAVLVFDVLDRAPATEMERAYLDALDPAVNDTRPSTPEERAWAQRIAGGGQ